MSDLVTLLVQCIVAMLQRSANSFSNGMPSLPHSGVQERVVSRAMACMVTVCKWPCRVQNLQGTQLSYLGTVRCFDETHKPAVYVNAYLGETLDPGNDSYAMLHKIVVPSIVKKS